MFASLIFASLMFGNEEQMTKYQEMKDIWESMLMIDLVGLEFASSLDSHLVNQVKDQD